MTFYCVTLTQLRRDVITVAVFEKQPEVLTSLVEVICTRPFAVAISDAFLQFLSIVSGNKLWIGQVLRHNDRNRNFIDVKIWVRRNDCSTREIHTLPGEIASETALLALQP